MKLLEFTIERDDKSGAFTASWDDPKGGGITTQADSLAELPDAINEAVRCHFLNRKSPRQVALHFEHDPILQLA
jgi:predicted RNase H-like HicB family nuclease